MKVSELIALLKQSKQEFGDMEIRLYNAMDYWYYPIKGVRRKTVKEHPDCSNIYCPVSDEWIGQTQKKFDKQVEQQILYLSAKD